VFFSLYDFDLQVAKVNKLQVFRALFQCTEAAFLLKPFGGQSASEIMRAICKANEHQRKYRQRISLLQPSEEIAEIKEVRTDYQAQ
jgi:hypothetical protein